MDIYNLCRVALKEEYAKGITQEELGKRAGISHAHVNRLLNGRSSFATLKLETLLKLLPSARLAVGSPLHGGNIQSVNGNGNIIAGRDAHANTPLCAEEIESFRSALIMELIELDIEISAKDQVLRLVRNFRRQ